MMRVAKASAGVGLAMLLLATAPRANAQTLLSDNFDDGNSTGWTISGGTWSVVTDGTPVLRQSGTSGDARASAGSTSWTTQSVQVRVKPLIWNGSNRFVAVLARRQANDSYYYATLRSSNTLELKKLVGGSATTLATKALTVTLGTWYTLRLDANGTSLTAYVNGTQQLTATDGQFSSGNAGVATFNATASFDDVVVTGAGAPTSTPTATPTSRPTATATARPTATATIRPTATPTTRPTATPTSTPTSLPTTRPTATPPASGIVTGSGGWFEAAWATWSSASGSSGYTVSYKPSSGSSWTTVDAPLVRGNRADIPGLLGNTSYDIRVAANGTDVYGTTTVSTMAYDRSGFAFDRRSPRGASGTSGGYNADGTVNPAAKILYISEATKDTVQLAVTKGTTTTTHTGLYAIQAARSSAKSQEPLILRFLGAVTPPGGLTDPNKMLQLKDNGNITYEGIGTNAQLYGWGLDIWRSTNIEVRNLSFKDQPEDQISFQSNNLNVWIHNNDHFLGKGLPGADADKLYGDGALDIKSGSSWFSVAYNYYHGNKKTTGIGFGGDTTALVMSFHHNYYDACGSRMPRISYVSMHVYNTYFRNAEGYAIAAANGCSAFVQNNYFESSNRPMIIASQGHDLNANGDSTLSNNPGGAIKAQGNYMDAYTADPARFDPDVDASLGPADNGGAVYNDFDANFGANYPLRLDTPEVAKAKVLQHAGRLR